jgi:hypothetical protein
MTSLCTAHCTQDPSRRPSVRQLLQHPLLAPPGGLPSPTLTSQQRFSKALQPVAETVAGDAESSVLDDCRAGHTAHSNPNGVRRQLFQDVDAAGFEGASGNAPKRNTVIAGGSLPHPEQRAPQQEKTQQRLLDQYQQLLHERAQYDPLPTQLQRLPSATSQHSSAAGHHYGLVPGPNASVITTSTELVSYPQHYRGLSQPHPAACRPVGTTVPSTNASACPHAPQVPVGDPAAPCDSAAATSQSSPSSVLSAPQPSQTEPTRRSVPARSSQPSSPHLGPHPMRAPTSRESSHGRFHSLISSNEDARLLLQLGRDTAQSGQWQRHSVSVAEGGRTGGDVPPHHSAQFQKHTSVSSSFLRGFATAPYASNSVQHSPPHPQRPFAHPYRPSATPQYANFSTQYAYDRFMGPAPALRRSCSATAAQSASSGAGAGATRGGGTGTKSFGTPPSPAACAPSSAPAERQLSVQECLMQVVEDLVQLPPRCVTTAVGELLVLSAGTQSKQRELVFVVPLTLKQASPARDSGSGTKYVRLLVSAAAPHCVVLGQVTGKARAEYERLVEDVKISHSGSSGGLDAGDLFQQDVHPCAYVHSGAERSSGSATPHESAVDITAAMKHDSITSATLSLLAVDAECRQYTVQHRRGAPKDQDGAEAAPAELPAGVATLVRRLQAVFTALKCRVPRRMFYFAPRTPVTATAVNTSMASGYSSTASSSHSSKLREFKCYLMSNLPLSDFYVVWKDGAVLRYEPASGALRCDLGPHVRPSMRWSGYVGGLDANMSISSSFSASSGRGAFVGNTIPGHFKERVSTALRAHAQCATLVHSGKAGADCDVVVISSE